MPRMSLAGRSRTLSVCALAVLTAAADGGVGAGAPGHTGATPRSVQQAIAAERQQSRHEQSQAAEFRIDPTIRRSVLAALSRVRTYHLLPERAPARNPRTHGNPQQTAMQYAANGIP